MKFDERAVLPVLAVMAIIGVVLIIGLMVVATLTLKMLLSVGLVGVGMYLFVKQDRLAGLSGNMKILVPIILIVLGLGVYLFG